MYRNENYKKGNFVPMGMAASQGRLLFMTARMSNNEFEQQMVAYSKQRLAEASSEANDNYLDALNATKYQLLTGYNGTNAIYENVTYNTLTGYNNVATGKQYVVKDRDGKIVVTPEIADAFEKSNGDYNKFLAKFGLTQVNLSGSIAEQKQAIHEAWDRYLVSVGASLDAPDEANMHVLDFGYTFFSDDVFDGYPTYSCAYARAENSTLDFSLYKAQDDNGASYYYINRYEVFAQVDPSDPTKLQAVYQTPDNEQNKVYLLKDVTVEYDEQTGTITYKYTSENGENIETQTLYASPDGVSAGGTKVSSEQRERFTKNANGTYTSEDGVTYSVGNQVKALNYEGTTTSQRELYDYAVALTESHYHSSTEHDALKYDANKISYYKNIYNEMLSKGYVKISEKENQKSDNWLITQLKTGKMSISYFSATEKAFVQSTLDDDESIAEKEDASKMAIAEQEYNAAMDRIEKEDKMFDMQLSKLESEHQALQTEYDAVVKVISKNVDSSFKTFQG